MICHQMDWKQSLRQPEQKLFELVRHSNGIYPGSPIK